MSLTLMLSGEVMYTAMVEPEVSTRLLPAAGCAGAFNLWDKPESQSFIWLENTGKMQYVVHDIANAPTHILSLEMADFNNDGLMDFVTGDMHAYPPFDRMGRVTVWMNNGKLANKK